MGEEWDEEREEETGRMRMKGNLRQGIIMDEITRMDGGMSRSSKTWMQMIEWWWKYPIRLKDFILSPHG